MKTCKKCNLPKPIESYTVDIRYKDGRYPWCFECRKAWRDGRKDKQKELHANWREQNREHVRQYGREYFQNNDEARKKNREAGRAREFQRYHTDEAFRDRKNQQRKTRYHSSPAVRKRRIGFALISVNTRRARIAGTNTRFTQAEWRALCAKYNHRCLCCGQEKPLTPDHVTPLSRGGSNSIENIQPLCLECNMKKHAKTKDYRPTGNDV